MDNADPQARVTEIENLVASNELNASTRRLMDLVTDFSTKKNCKREVINIRATYTDLSEDIRLFGKTEFINIRLTKLREQILEFADFIIEEYQTKEKITTQKDTTSRQPEYLPRRFESQDSGTPDNKNIGKTEYELEKEKFKQDRKLKNHPLSSIV
jgi:hypothetical protein